MKFSIDKGSGLCYNVKELDQSYSTMLRVCEACPIWHR